MTSARDMGKSPPFKLSFLYRRSEVPQGALSTLPELQTQLAAAPLYLMKNSNSSSFMRLCLGKWGLFALRQVDAKALVIWWRQMSDVGFVACKVQIVTNAWDSCKVFLLLLEALFGVTLTILEM